MKQLFTLILLSALTVAGWSQTKPVYVVSDRQHKPVKVYEASEDCIRFCNNKPYSNQQVNLYYRYDSTAWHPSNAIVVDDRQNPQPLNDAFLAKKTVYMVMQKNFDYLVDRVYFDLTEATKYASNWQEKVIELTYFYRDKKSYDEVYRIKRQRLKK